MVETLVKPSGVAEERAPLETGAGSSVFVFDKGELLATIVETRTFLAEYRLINERVSDSSEWNQEALRLVRRHRSLFGGGEPPSAKLAVLVGLFRLIARRMGQVRFNFRIPAKAGLIPEQRNEALEAFSGEFRAINAMLDGLVADIPALSGGGLGQSNERIQGLSQALSSFLKSLVRQDWDDLVLFMTHINLITTSAESHEIVGRIARIARDIYNSLNEFSRFLNVESLTRTTGELPDAVENLQSVIARLEDAVNTNLDSLENLGTETRETREWLADSMETAAACALEIEQLRAEHPEVEEGLAALQEIIATEIGGALGELDERSAGYEQTYMTMIANQSFQDLTGQTLKKVIAFIETMQFKLVELLPKHAQPQAISQPPPKEAAPEGPAAGKPIQSQEQVDQMLADLGF